MTAAEPENLTNLTLLPDPAPVSRVLAAARDAGDRELGAALCNLARDMAAEIERAYNLLVERDK